MDIKRTMSRMGELVEVPADIKAAKQDEDMCNGGEACSLSEKKLAVPADMKVTDEFNTKLER